MRELNNYRELEQNTQVYYLPHHVVQNETSTTTKFRVVFDVPVKLLLVCL